MENPSDRQIVVDNFLVKLRVNLIAARELTLSQARGERRTGESHMGVEYSPTDGYSYLIRINGGAGHNECFFSEVGRGKPTD